jgi:hypothetical protein
LRLRSRPEETADVEPDVESNRRGLSIVGHASTSKVVGARPSSLARKRFDFEGVDGIGRGA